MRKIVFYNIQLDKLNAYKTVLNQFEVDYKTINDGDLDLTLNEIFSKHDYDFKEPNGDFEVMFFKNMDNQILIDLLKQMNDVVKYNGLKVSYTNHNQDWNVRNLIAEVKREHELFKKLEILNEKLSIINSTVIKPQDKQDILNAFLLVKGRVEDASEVDKAIIKMDRIINGDKEDE